MPPCAGSASDLSSFDLGEWKKTEPNALPENLLPRAGDKGRRQLCAKAMLGYAPDGNAAAKENKYAAGKKGKRHLRSDSKVIGMSRNGIISLSFRGSKMRHFTIDLLGP